MMPGVESRRVSWWPVHEFLAAALGQMEAAPPLAGTPAWLALADGDPAKLLAVAMAGEHHILRMEIGQDQQAEASKAVAASTDWPQVAREISSRAAATRSGAYIPRTTGGSAA